jgi:hypothetical protein
MQDINTMKQAAINISARDYPRALSSLSDEFSLPVTINKKPEIEDDGIYIDPLPSPDQTEPLDSMRERIKSSLTNRSCNDLLNIYGKKAYWQNLSDLEIKFTAIALIEIFNEQGIDPASFWNSLV